MRHTGRREWETIQPNHVELASLIDRQDVAGIGACIARHCDEAICGIRTREPMQLPPVGTRVLGHFERNGDD